MSEQSKKKRSMKTRVRFSVILLVIVQALSFILVVFGSGTISKLERDAYQMLVNQTLGHRDESWINSSRMANSAAEMAQSLTQKLSEAMPEMLLPNALSEEASRNRLGYAAVEAVMDAMITYIDQNALSGVYVAFTGNDTAQLRGAEVPCLYLKKTDLNAAGTVSAEVAPTAVLERYGVPAHNQWRQNLTLPASGEAFESVAKPIKAITISPDLEIQNYGYWSVPYRNSQDGDLICTYTLPLMGEDGNPFGVFGIELTSTQAGEIFTRSQTLSVEQFNFLVRSTDSSIASKDIICGDPAVKALLDNAGNIIYTPEQTMDIAYIGALTLGERNYTAVAVPVELYGNAQVYANESWMLFNVTSNSVLFSTSNMVLWGLLIAVIASVLVGLLFATLTVSSIAAPIQTIMRDISSLNPEKPFSFSETNVKEFDLLTNVLTKTSDNMRATAMRTSAIIDLVGISIGCFEINRENKRVFMSDSLFRMLSIPKEPDGGMFISLEVWEKYMADLTETTAEPISSEDSPVYLLEKDGKSSWLRLRSADSEDQDLGLFIDVTEEVLLSRKTERERILDPLTGLLNRVAFQERVQQQINRDPDSMGLMIYCDLDNLKFYNDYFDHDVGDSYIQKAAECINLFVEQGGDAARISGDEMVIFMHGYGSKTILYEIFQSVYAQMGRINFITPDGVPHKVRMSVGLAFYPEHGKTPEKLIRYADFAMYEIKHSIKGSVKEFDEISYNEKSFLFHKKHLLDKFIEGNLVRYAFQPIVDIKTGHIHAFEALMRPQMEDMRSPMQVLQLARSQSKLYQIERMTLNNAMGHLEEHLEEFKGSKLFINTIPNQVLMGRDMDDFYTRFSDLFSHVVFELTEDEYTDSDFIEAKQTLLRSFGAKVAIDDFGAGYSNDLKLLTTTPDYLKIDMSIVRDIDTDPDRQKLLHNILTFTKGKNIKIIAEGCETFSEVDKLCEMGVDYLQGYYVAKPNFDIKDLADGMGEQLRKLYEGHHGTQ